MTRFDGGPAFPFTANDSSNQHMQAQGMSLRDYFAGQAMVAIYSGMLAEAGETVRIKGYPLTYGTALMAYETADAMLAAREGGAA